MRKFWKVTNTDDDTYVLIPDSQAIAIRAFRNPVVKKASEEYEYSKNTNSLIGVVAYWRTNQGLIEDMMSADQFDAGFLSWLDAHEVDIATVYDAEGIPITSPSIAERKDLDPLH